MTDRPPEFDARVMAYLPALRKLAHKLCNDIDEREELVNDTIVYALDGWAKFRADGGFYNWLTLNMRSLAQSKRGRTRTLAKYRVNDPVGKFQRLAATAPRQEETTHVNQVLSLVAACGRDGQILMEYAMGDKGREIGIKHGVSGSRAQQLAERARATLRKRGFRAAA